MAVLPSALTATDWPWAAAPVLPVPTSFDPCWADGYGAAITVKLLPLETVPPAVVNDTAPVTAPGITMATKTLPVFDTTMAVWPPMVKAVGEVKFVPSMVTNVPTGPVAGLKEVMVGARANSLTGKIVAKNTVPKTTMARIAACFNCFANKFTHGSDKVFFMILCLNMLYSFSGYQYQFVINWLRQPGLDTWFAAVIIKP
jgi:hypothetical protein